MIDALVAAAIVLTPPVGGAEPSTPANTPAKTPATVRHGYLMISPAGLAVARLGQTRDTKVARATLLPSYRWAFAAGANFEPVPGLLLGAAASFEQVVWAVRDYRRGDELGSSAIEEPLCFAGECYGWDERVLGTLLRLGLGLRIGWVHRRVFAWALVEPHLAIVRLRIDCNDARAPHCDRRHTDLGPALGGGLGIAYRFVDRVALGLEGRVDHAWLDRFDDPFEAIRTWELGATVIFSF